MVLGTGLGTRLGLHGELALPTRPWGPRVCCAPCFTATGFAHPQVLRLRTPVPSGQHSYPTSEITRNSTKRRQPACPRLRLSPCYVSGHRCPAGSSPRKRGGPLSLAVWVRTSSAGLQPAGGGREAVPWQRLGPRDGLFSVTRQRSVLGAAANSGPAPALTSSAAANRSSPPGRQAGSGRAPGPRGGEGPVVPGPRLHPAGGRHLGSGVPSFPKRQPGRRALPLPPDGSTFK